MNLIGKVKKGFILMSVFMILLGLGIMFWPKTSLITFCYIAGVYLVISGLIKIAGYFSNEMYGLAFEFDLAFGIILVILGIIFLVHPAGLLSILPIVVGIFVAMDGIFSIQTAVESKRFGLKNWRLILLVAIITAAAGIFLVLNPLEGVVAVMVVLGAVLLISGIKNLFVAIYTIKTIKEIKKDSNIIDM